MREIKFRVYDKDTKIMHICGEDIHDVVQFGAKEENYIGYYYNLQNGESSFDKDSTYVLMQYTGLKDKNGKEIYEGDIIKYGDITKGLVRYSEKYAQYVLVNTGSVKDEFEPLGDYNTEVFEIIGNEFDNPNLLKD